ncbi:ABC transporter permease subunit [Bacillus salipaludis]|uniref:ABC transporter permease subunit n=1 Tax=Bacillus salipaludis TaxID=2547811 RepID=A0ABW8RGU3_9BACI
MKNIQLVLGVVFLAIFLLFAAFGSHLPFVDQDLKEETMKMTGEGIKIPPYPPSKEHPLGSDRKGRDLISLLVIGTRETLLFVTLVVVIRYSLAVPLGMAATVSKPINALLSGWNYILSFIPPIFLVALLLGIPFIFFSTHRPFWFVVILSSIEVGRLATIVKNDAKYISNQLFVKAAISTGCTMVKLFTRHIFPHLKSQLITSFVNDMARVLFLLSQLAVVQLFLNQKFTSELDGSYSAENISLAYPMYLQLISRDIWSSYWVPLSAVLFISVMIITFLLIADGLKKYFKTKYRLLG